jgi:hypothetical protein
MWLKKIGKGYVVRRRGDERSFGDHLNQKKSDERILVTTWLEEVVMLFFSHPSYRPQGW